jgi:hypothetical protein
MSGSDARLSLPLLGETYNDQAQSPRILQYVREVRK